MRLDEKNLIKSWSRVNDMIDKAAFNDRTRKGFAKAQINMSSYAKL